MQASSGIKVRGIVEVFASHRRMNGPMSRTMLQRLRMRDPSAFQRVLRHRNIVTDAGIQTVSALLAGAVGSPSVGGTPRSPAVLDTMHINTLKAGGVASPAEPTAGDTLLASTGNDLLGTWTGIDLNIAYINSEPGKTGTRFYGFVPTVENVGDTYTEIGLFAGDGTLIARSLLAQRATGSITFADQPAAEEIVTINDGFTTKIFEFDGLGPDPIPVVIDASKEDTAENLKAEINLSSLAVTATRSGAVITLTHDQTTALANNAVTTDAGNITVAGLTGGYDGVLKTGVFALHFYHTLWFERQ